MKYSVFVFVLLCYHLIFQVKALVFCKHDDCINSIAMSKNTQSTNKMHFESAEFKQITARKSYRLTQKLLESKNAGSTADCTSHSLQSENFPYRHGLLEKKSPRRQWDKTKKQKNSFQKRRIVSVGRATVPITPQMIRVAVKELQTRRVYVSSALIASHLKRSYPIENDPDALKKELDEKLNCAVSVGLIAKCGNDKYCIPTLRQQASLNKTALTSFWDTYYRSRAPSTMDHLFTLGIPKVYKKRESVAPERSHDNRSYDYKVLDEIDS